MTPERNVTMFLRAGLLLIICIWLPSLASAEFYRYKDENGVTRFTDNLAEVPEDQQPKSYKEPDDFLTPEQRAEKARKESLEDRKARETAQKEEKKNRKEEKKSSLKDMKKEKAALDAEYAKIRQDEQALVKEREKGLATSSIKAHNEKMLRFKEKVAEYKEKQKAYTEKLDTFNSTKNK